MGSDTFWVDVVGNTDSVVPEDGFMMDFNMDDVPSSSSPAVSSANTYQQKVGGTKPSGISDELKTQIVKECTEDLISPTELSKKHGMSVVSIRNMVKGAGKKLPNKYKVTGSATKTLNSAAPVVQNPPTSYDPPTKVVTVGPSGQVVKQVIVSETTAPSAGVKTVTNQLQLPQKSVPQTILVQKGHTITQMQTIRAPELTKPPPVVTTAASLPIQMTYKAKLIPGKLAVCKNCGSYSNDFNRCMRCKKTLPVDCKMVDEKKPNEKPANNTSGVTANKVESLRNVRILHKGKRKTTHDEPECIALSSDEEEEDEDSKDGTESGSPKAEGSGNQKIYIVYYRYHILLFLVEIV